MRKCQSPGGILPQCAKNAWAGISGISKVLPDFRNCLRLIRYIMLRGWGWEQTKTPNNELEWIEIFFQNGVF